MRNLEQYPVTADEVIAQIDGILHDIQRAGRVGGTEGMILEAVKRYLIDNPRAVATIVESLKF